ncbi:hypothetical protein FQA39_LY17362 [Lamprigera yunnana]|nr:hypothetical protein FQA39_LY17362 [Lamprigera yunnana]
MSEVHNLEVLDPESGLQYDLSLRNEDFVRAQEDQHFLSLLLFHAKANRTAENAESLCNTSISEDQNLKTNYSWKYNQVVELIKSMSLQMEDLNPKKRKQVFEHVANDLQQLKVDKPSVTNLEKLTCINVPIQFFVSVKLIMAPSKNYCSYLNCNKSLASNPGLSFFRFSLDAERCNKWVQNCGNINLILLSEIQLRMKTVCAVHFVEKQLKNLSRNLLVHDAIPVDYKNVQGKVTKDLLLFQQERLILKKRRLREDIVMTELSGK